MSDLVTLNLILKDEVDASSLDVVTRQLRDEIACLEVERVELGLGSDLPPGAKGDPITIGSIIVSLASAGVFTGLVELLKSWALRREGRSISIKAEVDGRKLEMTFSPAESSEQEMARFADKIMQSLQPSKKKR
jgi:hypothetical protein